MSGVGLVINAVDLTLRIIWWLVLAHVIFSWLPVQRWSSPWYNIARTVNRLVLPLLRPFRVLIPMGGAALDLSPIILLLVLDFGRRILVRVLLGLA